MNINSESIEYASAIVFALLAIVVAVVLLLKKQNDGLRKPAIIVIILAIVAGTISSFGMYLSKQWQDELARYQHPHHPGQVAKKDYGPPTSGAGNNEVNIDTLKANGASASNLLPQKTYGPIAKSAISGKAVYVDTVKVVPGYN